jgi:putative transposase
MKTICDVLGVARSNIAVRARAPLAKPLGRPPQPEADLLAEIKAVIGNMPTYGYRRVWALLNRHLRSAHEAGAPDHAEPRTDTRTSYRPSSWPHA